MNKTRDITMLVYSWHGISSHDICERLGYDRHTVSGILSTLKKRGQMHNNDGLWYPYKMFNVDKVIDRLRDVHCEDDINTPWTEGYLSALADHMIITEDEFEALTELTKQ